MLCKKGHSFEVDIWSMGCILWVVGFYLLYNFPVYSLIWLQVYFVGWTSTFWNPDAERHVLQNQEKRVPCPVSYRATGSQSYHEHASSWSFQPVSLFLVFLKKYIYEVPNWTLFFTRPNVDQILNDDFMTQGYMPSRLPLSCLTMPPRFDPRLSTSIIAVRRPLGEINRESPLISNEVQGNLTCNSNYSPHF